MRYESTGKSAIFWGRFLSRLRFVLKQCQKWTLCQPRLFDFDRCNIVFVTKRKVKSLQILFQVDSEIVLFRNFMLTYISNSAHYKEVLSRVQSVKHMLWIGTADIKDLYVEIGKEKKPFLALIAQLIRRGVEVRLIHAKEPGQNFRGDFDKYGAVSINATYKPVGFDSWDDYLKSIL